MKALKPLETERVMTEAKRCLLCYDAPCSKACPNKCEPSKFIQSLHFENERGAVEQVKEKGVSLECIQNCNKRYCEKVCIHGKLDTPLSIQLIHNYLSKMGGGENENRSIY